VQPWQNRLVRWLARAVPFVAVLAVGPAAAQAPAPSGAASAWAIAISVPGQDEATTTQASAPPSGAPATGGAFAYPADGSIVAAASTTASATTAIAANAGAQAESDVTGLSLLQGAITADAVTARAYAGTGPGGAGGNFGGSRVRNLRVTGVPTVGPHVHLGDWGTLDIGTQSVDRTAPAGARGYRGTVVELDLKLTADHGGLPAGSEIRIGYAQASAQTAPPAAGTTTTTAPAVPTTTAPEPSPGPSAGDSPRQWPRHPGRAGLVGIHPKLTAGRYVFPVYGPTAYGDTYGAVRADTAYHHGDDVFGELGQPLVACADGTIFSLGWNRIGGNSLWIRDAAGNEFYYAHLSAFSTQVANGAHVRAGQVIGFMGRTGDAEGTPAHLHFEVHPVSLLYLGYDGAVDPTPYLEAWQHAEDLPFPVAAGWAPSVPGGRPAPPPAAMLLGMRDISSADGLDPASLRRALRPPARLVQPLVPAALKPLVDLGSQASAGD
jgi:murein DD-endopeptidase MepM/ murein hydrolase activator NlpD